jgi:hypothetical protein
MFSFHYLRLRTAHFYRSRPEKRQVYKSHPIKKREKKTMWKPNTQGMIQKANKRVTATHHHLAQTTWKEDNQYK